MEREGRRLRVLFEGTTLGNAQFHVSARAGFYRMTDSALRALLRADECELTLAVVDEPVAELGLHFYRRSLPQPDRIHLQTSAGRVAVGATFAAGKWLAEHLPVARTLALELGPFVYRGVKQRATRGVQRTTRPWKGFDVVHSTVEPLPDHIDAPRVLTIHDTIPLTNPEWCEPHTVDRFRFTLRSLRPDDTILTVSHHVRERVCDQLRVPPERVHVAPLAADGALFRPIPDGSERRRRLRALGVGERPYFLAVGRIDARKNLGLLIEAFRDVVLQQRIDAALVLVGNRGHGHQPALDAARAHPEVASRIVWTGHVDDAVLPVLYSGALAYVFPSLAEGFGLPALEAMQCGAPVIASNATSLPEVVGDAGLLFEPTDRAALAQHLHTVATSTTTRSDLACRGLARAELFSWDRHARQTLGAYRQALHNANRH